MSSPFPSSGPVAGSRSIIPGNTATINLVPKHTSWAKTASSKILKTTISTIAAGPLNDFGTAIEMFSNICQGSTEYSTRYANFVQRVQDDLNSARQAALNPNNTFDNAAMLNFQTGLEVILREALDMGKIHSALKRLNRTEIAQRLDELECALDRHKTDFVFICTMVSTTRALEIDLAEPPTYKEISWDDLTVTSSPLHRTEEHDPTDQSLVCSKVLWGASLNGQDVSLVQYSGNASRKKKHQLLMRDLKQCATGRHKNVLELLGGAFPTTATPDPYLVFRTCGEMDSTDFMRTNTSLQALMTFIKGTEAGSSWMFSQEVRYIKRDRISTSSSGLAIVHPPGVKLLTLTGKQSTKRWAGHIINDIETEHKDTALPLREIYQVLNACSYRKDDLKARVEGIFMGYTLPVRKKWIYEVAQRCDVPLKLTWRCDTELKPLNFVVNLASFGTFTGDNSGETHASFTDWTPLTGHSSSLAGGSSALMLNPVSCRDDWVDNITTRVTYKEGSRSTFKDANVHKMRQNPNCLDWLTYDDVMRNARGLNTSCLVVLNYGNRICDRLNDYRAAFERFSQNNLYPSRTIHFVRGVNLRFKINLNPHQITMPVYLHRKPSSQSPREYWGFLSQFEDPTIPPESPVSDIMISYQLDIVSALDGDSWEFRVDEEHEKEYSCMPGAWTVT